MYIQQRGNTFYFRFNIPERYRHALGWSIRRPLCECPVISTTVAKTLGNSLRRLMEKNLDDKTITNLVNRYIEETLSNIDHYINVQESVSVKSAQAHVEILEEQKTEYDKALFKRSYKCVDNVVDDLLENTTVNTLSRNKLSRAILRAAMELMDVQIKAKQGEPVPADIGEASGRSLIAVTSVVSV